MQVTIPRAAFLRKRWTMSHSPSDLSAALGWPAFTCPCGPLPVEATRANLERLAVTVRGEPFVVVHREPYVSIAGDRRLLLHLEPYERGDLDSLPDRDLVLEMAG